MKKTILLPVVALALTLGACSKDAPQVAGAPEVSASESQALGDVQLFAEALSKALAEEPELRSLIKRQALQRFDNNTDALYQHFKGLKTSDGKTIREILQQYWAGTEASFRSFEAHAPLLNVHLPDLSLFEQASAQNWDTQSEEVAVALVREGLPYTPLYIAGDSVDRIESGEIPAIPTLVINQNKRVKVASSFRSLSGEAEFRYTFLDPTFDGTKSGQEARNIYVYEEPETDDYSFTAQELNTITNELWKRVGRGNPALQRASIYYPNDTLLDQTVNEQLLRFKVSPSVYGHIADERREGGLGDPHLPDGWYYKTMRGRDASIDEVIRECWTQGSFVFEFEVHTPLVGGGTEVSKLVIPVLPKQLFVMNPDRWRKHPTFFRHTEYRYRIYPGSLESRWVYPARINKTQPLRVIGSWNLANQALSKKIFVREFDNEGERTEKRTHSTQFVAGANAGIDLAISKVITALKLGASASYTQTKATEFTLSYKDKSDDLGSVDLFFNDPIIYSFDGAKYTLRDINTGSVTMTFAPIKSGLY